MYPEVALLIQNVYFVVLEREFEMHLTFVVKQNTPYIANDFWAYTIFSLTANTSHSQQLIS